ncbi:DUF6924 domain-containing protein [uncultured Jatrophihabitans sp.]|uniref:DUF6924 domain-containing protein n=1 Tax=uncultured Jatrophihabitans sp. TaxID=1610747 RepID=UPI0035C955D0
MARQLPRSRYALLVRTDFTDEQSWDEVFLAARAPDVDGYSAQLTGVGMAAFDGAHWEIVRDAVPDDPNGSAVVFIVDAETIRTPSRPILVASLGPDRAGQRPFRCVPSAVASVENNLNTGNMDWLDFVSAVGADGVFTRF